MVVKHYRFRIYPDGYSKRHGKKFFQVWIFDNEKHMYLYNKYVRELQGLTPWKRNNWRALCTHWGKSYDKRPGMKHCIGSLIFEKDGSGDKNTVTHELLHAALFFYRRELKRKPRQLFLFKKHGDEELCYMLGRMVSAYWHEWGKKLRFVDKVRT